jgi:ketosteroid isomerase-like protein
MLNQNNCNMKKKNGFNIMLFVFIINLIFILSCTKGGKSNSSGSLLQVDKDFSEMSMKDGMFKAFLFYIAEDGVILSDNSFPTKGKAALIESFAGRSDTSFVLTWDPLYEKISDSGDLGYTYGIHSTLNRATGQITKGTYITVWLEQADGSWKFVLDTGTQGLPDLNAVSQLLISGKGCKNTKN